MKVRVVDPRAWMLTSVEEARCQLARCAFAAGLSRGRLDIFERSQGQRFGAQHGDEGCPHELLEHGQDEKAFEDAEALIGRLLSIKPYPHETVIEHSAVSFLFRMSRIASHELVRHRLTAITQQSTRYCESGKDGSVTFIRPLDRPESDCGEYEFIPLHSSERDADLMPQDTKMPIWAWAASQAIENYQLEMQPNDNESQPRKREYARYLLPHCIEVWLQMTANFREWRHIIRLRTHKAAAPEMRLLIGQVREQLAEVSPVLLEEF